nr:GGDEF domain-containing protein [uncultured Steroidobacter sp.]
MWPAIRRLIAGGCAAFWLVVTPCHAALDAQQAKRLLTRADSIKTSDPKQFAEILATLAEHAASSSLDTPERQHLQYLQAWRNVYSGDYTASVPLLETVIEEAGDPALRLRARATLVNVHALATNYDGAFSHLNRLLDELPEVTDPSARQLGMQVAAYLYNKIGEYDSALSYAKRLIAESGTGRGACLGAQLELQALYESRRVRADSPELQRGVATCVKEGELLIANAIRTYIVNLHLQQKQFQAAIELLLAHHEEVQQTRYPRGIAEWDSLLAQAYHQSGNDADARRYALRTIEFGVKDRYTEPLVTAYRVLYEIASRQGDAATALSYLEKYVSADKGYLDDVSARQLAYERARHENASNKLQIDALNQENKLLQLQRQLASKAAETSRLYIALLIVVVLFITLWAYRTKRSQLHFMKLSQVDSLTGIANRPRFIQLAEAVLEAAHKSQQQASVVLCDLDHFKSINDRFGHAAGDHVLRQAVSACQGHLRVSDIFGRVGGEEFGIVLPGCGLEDAKQRAERLRVALSAIDPHYDGQRCPVSGSFGVTSTEVSGYELRQLLAHADAALYRAKAAGRDRVVPYTTTGDAPAVLDDELTNAGRA